MPSARQRAGTGQGAVFEWAPVAAGDLTFQQVPASGYSSLGIAVTGGVDCTTDEVDVSDLSMSFDSYIPTTSGAEGTLTVRHAQGNAGCATLIGWLTDPQIVWFRITEKDGSTIIFPGFTKGYSVSFARKDVVDAEVPFRLSAAPIFTPKANS